MVVIEVMVFTIFMLVIIVMAVMELVVVSFLHSQIGHREMVSSHGSHSALLYKTTRLFICVYHYNPPGDLPSIQPCGRQEAGIPPQGEDPLGEAAPGGLIELQLHLVTMNIS